MYWHWTLSWQDPGQSTVFDDSPTSIGSNGVPTTHGPTNISAFGLNLPVAPGTGGGCIFSGPFKNYTVNLGPRAFAPINEPNGLSYNPRCLQRDLSVAWSNQTKPTDVVKVISSCADLGCFDTRWCTRRRALYHWRVDNMAEFESAGADVPGVCNKYGVQQ